MSKEKIEFKPRPIGRTHEQRLAQVVKVIHFEDHGQDFLRWGVDKYGNVIFCTPFQEWLWQKMIVLHPEELKVGDTVYYKNKERPENGICGIKYPVEKIVEV